MVLGSRKMRGEGGIVVGREGELEKKCAASVYVCVHLLFMFIVVVILCSKQMGEPIMTFDLHCQFVDAASEFSIH